MAHMVSVLIDSVSVLRIGETAIKNKMKIIEDFVYSTTNTVTEREGREGEKERKRGGGRSRVCDSKEDECNFLTLPLL